jgi:catechol 2,3-dioxygenase-like lactoylglutathione lyase family enzyme
MPIKQIVPVLRVADVARSIEWYRGTLGFAADPFPATPPYEFAILRQGTTELMLRRGSPTARMGRRHYDWDVCPRIENPRMREVFAAFETRGIVTRRLERMAYDLAEFEVTDPDGYILCLSQHLEDSSDLPTRRFDGPGLRFARFGLSANMALWPASFLARSTQNTSMPHSG